MRTPSSVVLTAAAAVTVLALGTTGATAGGGVTLEIGCTPDAVRPLAVSLFTCHATVTSTGNQAIEGARIRLLPPAQLRIAFPSHFDQRLDGELLPNQPNGPDVALGTLAPGQSRTLTIRFIAAPEIEGDYGFEFQVLGDVGGVTGDRTARFSARSDAAAPPTGLEMQLARVDELTPLPPPLDYLAAPLPEAMYDLMIGNRTSAAVTELSVAMRFQPGAAPELDPMPSSIDRALGLATWDLSDFGTTSLGPGEELHVRAAFTSATPNACTEVQPLAIAEAPAGEFAAPPSFGAPIGTCQIVGDDGHACFQFGSLVGYPYPVPCEQNQGECFPPDAPGFPVPENGVVCISVIGPTPAPAANPPAATTSPPVAGLPETGAPGSNTSSPWAVAAPLIAAALSMAAIGLSLRKRRL